MYDTAAAIFFQCLPKTTRRGLNKTFLCLTQKKSSIEFSFEKKLDGETKRKRAKNMKKSKCKCAPIRSVSLSHTHTHTLFLPLRRSLIQTPSLTHTNTRTRT